MMKKFKSLSSVYKSIIILSLMLLMVFVFLLISWYAFYHKNYKPVIENFNENPKAEVWKKDLMGEDKDRYSLIRDDGIEITLFAPNFLEYNGNFQVTDLSNRNYDGEIIQISLIYKPYLFLRNQCKLIIDGQDGDKVSTSLCLEINPNTLEIIDDGGVFDQKVYSENKPKIEKLIKVLNEEIINAK